jgi:hypothetical protein
VDPRALITRRAGHDPERIERVVGAAGGQFEIAARIIGVDIGDRVFSYECAKKSPTKIILSFRSVMQASRN